MNTVKIQMDKFQQIDLSDLHGNIFATIRIAELLQDTENDTPRLIRIEGIEEKITVIGKYVKMEEELPQ